MTRPYTFRPGEREKRAERMRLLNASPEFADRQQRAATARTKRLHEADRWRRAWEREGA